MMGECVVLNEPLGGVVVVVVVVAIMIIMAE